ncbi:cleavage and polyadenylation specificity factor subunit 1 isoform X1 [Petromyzon marinus]|uniref:Cleavage and polyadenylation specificity factor subunit 1 n=1 Tax=Petromyzon marinus TaxID=7757 RepID=A0AAJ7U834_PETMA|nr:cleavage and polyadenylation specificity factor subunit 1 isoform X1 [Petromyzon marinus]
MYSVHRKVHPPTGLEHAVYCHFFSSQERNLVVAGGSQLQIYRLIHDTESVSKGDKPTDGKPRKDKLEFMSSFSLFGNIMSMASVRLSGSSRDALLLAFMDAKLSVVEYDPATHDLKTLSLHYFEEDEIKDGFHGNVHVPVVRVDPDARCAAMLVYGTRLVVLPFRRETLADEAEGGVSEGQKPSLLPSYVIDLRGLDEKLLNVLDMQFLHGYYEPTLLILFEPNQTWPGRVAVRQDTCGIVAISLNIAQRVHPIIWSLSSLPFDCTQALAVPKPIGGVVIFAVNSLLYMNQSVPPYGASLNSITHGSTAFPLRIQDGVKMTLDCAQATFVSYDKIVISLKGGEIYVLTLIIDGMRSVRSFHFDKAAASVLTTCMLTMEPGYLFLGSRLGNSLLLKYTEKLTESAAETMSKDKPEEPPNKRKRTEAGDWMAKNVALLDDMDEIEVYGSEAQSGTQLATYSFEVCDSILNIGPCANVAMGEPAFLSEEFQNRPEPDLELVCCSGYGKNGALSVVQRSIRPQVVTTFELPGCYDMWTVISPVSEKREEGKRSRHSKESESEAEPEKEEQKEAPLEDEKKKHGFLILSRDDSTMILQTGQEIMELDHSGFNTQGPTVFAGNLGGNRYILQVSPMGVRLMEGTKQLQHIPLDLGSPIVHCSAADPYAIILSEEGQIMQLLLKEDKVNGSCWLAAAKQPVHSQSKVLALCVYRDVSGMFTMESLATLVRETPVTRCSQAEEDAPVAELSSADDEEEMLYGESNASVFGQSKRDEANRPEEVAAASARAHAKAARGHAEPTFWSALVRDSGVLEIYQLPEWRLVFLVKNFPVGQRVLVDSSSGQAAAVEAKKEEGAAARQGEMPVVHELLLAGLGHRQSKPFLFVYVDQELLIYEAFPYDSLLTINNLKVRFKKVQHAITFRERKARPSSRKVDGEPAGGADGAQDETAAVRGRVVRFRTFDDVSGYSGVFICGPFPHWVFMTSRGALRMHPMHIDGPIESFAAFHNVNCPRGFLYFNKRGDLRISVLPTHLSYDSSWPLRKIPLRCTPHHIVYHVESKVFAVTTSVLEICNRIPRMSGEEKEFEMVDRDERFIYPTQEKFSIQLISPVSWETIPNTRIDLEDWEHVTCLKNISLKSEETVSGVKGYLAAGTCLVHGEEVTCRGRILIMDVIEVVPEPGQPITKNKFKVLYEKEQKGPVTALCHCNGFLVSAIGQKIFLWSLKNNELQGMAFIDTQLYIHQMISIKNFILAADIMKSVSLLRYQEDSKTLSLVSRDVKPLEVYGIEFMVDSSQMGFLVSDREKNLIIYTYQPEARESYGGTRLLRRADFNVGAHVNTLWRTACRSQPTDSSRRGASSWDTKQVTWFASLDGGMGLLLPMAEKTYRRLLMLQNALVTLVPHLAGLNPKAFRMLHSDRRTLQNTVRNVLDGELLFKYLHLSTMERSELAKKIGTTPDTIIEDILDIDRVTAHF